MPVASAIDELKRAEVCVERRLDLISGVEDHPKVSRHRVSKLVDCLAYEEVEIAHVSIVVAFSERRGTPELSGKTKGRRTPALPRSNLLLHRPSSKEKTRRGPGLLRG
jgi:hypothetical protein